MHFPCLYINLTDMIKKLVFLICLLWVQNATALCAKNNIEVVIRARPGKVVYDHSLSRHQFQSVSPVPVSPNTLGLTLTNLKISASGIPYLKKEQNRYCIGIQKVVFEIGYDNIKVLIDKKYPVNSCPYRVIKEHENYHVAVSQQGMVFFKKDIEKALKDAVSELRPEYAYSETRAEQIMQKQFDTVLKRINPLVDHINRKITEKNYEIDTPESYRKTKMLCPKW